jgi:hypothetical protein
MLIWNYLGGMNLEFSFDLKLTPPQGMKEKEANSLVAHIAGK